jgi:hypothetical protein
VQIKELHREKPTEVSEGLYALSCGPDTQVQVYEIFSINGVRYSTVDHEKSLHTQNSGVMTTVTNEGQSVEFYGVLGEVIQLMYNSSVQSHRTVVVLRCDWYNLDGTTKSIDIHDDEHYRSVNIKSFWASFSSVNWGEKHCIRIPVAFCLYLVKIIQILTN